MTKIYRFGLFGLLMIFLVSLTLAGPPASGVNQRNTLMSTALGILGDDGSAGEASASPFIPPGHGSTPPGHGGTPPGQTTPPGHGGTPPGQGDTPPGQDGGTPPGQSGDNPGQGGNPPGHD